MDWRKDNIQISAARPDLCGQVLCKQRKESCFAPKARLHPLDVSHAATQSKR